MTPRQKLRAISDLYWTARRLKAAALRDAHPEWDAARVEREVRRIFLSGRLPRR